MSLMIILSCKLHLLLSFISFNIVFLLKNNDVLLCTKVFFLKFVKCMFFPRSLDNTEVLAAPSTYRCCIVPSFQQVQCWQKMCRVSFFQKIFSYQMIVQKFIVLCTVTSHLLMEKKKNRKCSRYSKSWRFFIYCKQHRIIKVEERIKWLQKFKQIFRKTCPSGWERNERHNARIKKNTCSCYLKYTPGNCSNECLFI